MTELAEKETHLRRLVAGLAGVAVAYSGGVDSTFLLAVCRQVLGAERVLALTAHSVLVPEAERRRAVEVARRLGVRHKVVEIDVLANPDIAANRADRCYHCKLDVFAQLHAVGQAEGLAVLVHGANVDDQGDYRPGMEAAEALGVRAPLLEAGLTKADVRVLSRQMGLDTWDLPSMACLASRVPYDTPLTPEALARVDAAESFLRERLGLGQLRVRDHFPSARIEVPEDRVEALARPGVREEIVSHLEGLGYQYVTLDLRGFRSGSLNEALGQ